MNFAHRHDYLQYPALQQAAAARGGAVNSEGWPRAGAQAATASAISGARGGATAANRNPFSMNRNTGNIQGGRARSRGGATTRGGATNRGGASNRGAASNNRGGANNRGANNQTRNRGTNNTAANRRGGQNNARATTTAASTSNNTIDLTNVTPQVPRPVTGTIDLTRGTPTTVSPHTVNPLMIAVSTNATTGRQTYYINNNVTQAQAGFVVPAVSPTVMAPVAGGLANPRFAVGPNGSQANSITARVMNSFNNAYVAGANAGQTVLNLRLQAPPQNQNQQRR